jgi:hypothetical protein
VSWVEVFAVLVVSHLVGDYLLQTDWQARHKRGGLGSDPVARRALVLHVVSYTIAFVPALIWLRHTLGAGGIVGIAALIFIPHLVQDDGRLLSGYLRSVKGCSEQTAAEIFTSVDQSFHIVTLFGIALVAAG